MNWRPALYIAVTATLTACATRDGGETLASLHDVKIQIKEAQIEGGLEKAIESYRQFLNVTSQTAMTPEAIRRLADLKVEKEYGLVAGAPTPAAKPSLAPPTAAAVPAAAAAAASAVVAASTDRESDKDFEARTTAAQPVASSTPADSEAEQRANALEAIALYKKLLAEYPLYERNDQVLYQMARAYEELGEVDEAMKVMNRLVATYPNSYILDEVQFRRGEYFFTRKKYLDAEEAYKAIVKVGEGSSFYELALYKLGWSLYKQELYEDGLHNFIALLDHKVKAGTDFNNIEDDIERQRVDDTFRVVSFSFSYMGGPESVDDYFARFGARVYAENVYSNLGEFYLEKRRYNDAALSYKSFVRLYPYHRASPRFDMRVIEIYKQGGFPKLVIDANKDFARTYGLRADYWQHNRVESYPEVLGYLKQTLKELANHYHALYQEKRFEKNKPENFSEALVWYREYLTSFPKDADSPPINYQLADLLLENKNFADAAREYEHTAYDYQPHAQASEAGYAAVYAYREDLNSRSGGLEVDRARREVIRASLRFGDTFPNHEKAAIVLGGAADDLYEMKDYAQAVTVGRRVIATYPAAEPKILRSAWLVVAHGSFDLQQFAEAEEGYTQVLDRTALDDKSRDELYENLAASIYKQGEQATKAEDHATAARHYLRIAQHAPNSKIRPTAEYDGAVALIQLKDWDGAAEVLRAFRTDFPGHELQAEVTKRIAFVYREAGKLALAAEEYERIETESQDDEVRRGALLIAADLYEEAKLPERAILVFKRYLEYFPRPLEPAIEARQRLADVYKALGDTARYHAQLKQIVADDASAGAERTDRTRYLAAMAALITTEPLFQQLVDIKLVQPFQPNLKRKQAAMKKALDAFGKLPRYQVGVSTAAATYYIAEIYYHFSRALMESERPDNLSPLELEEYELLIEEQAYPFEEKAIQVHAKNMELIGRGIYNDWVDRSLGKLAVLMPARYARAEESSGYLDSIELYQYDFVRKPVEAPAAGPEAAAAGASQPQSEAPATAAEPPQPEGAEPAAGSDGEVAAEQTPPAVEQTPPAVEQPAAQPVVAPAEPAPGAAEPAADQPAPEPAATPAGNPEVVQRQPAEAAQPTTEAQ